MIRLSFDTWAKYYCPKHTRKRIYFLGLWTPFYRQESL